MGGIVKIPKCRVRIYKQFKDFFIRLHKIINSFNKKTVEKITPR